MKKVDISKFLPKKKKVEKVAADTEDIPKPEPKKKEKPKKKIAHKVKKDDLPPQLYQRNTDSLPFGAMMRHEDAAESSEAKAAKLASTEDDAGAATPAPADD
jgi:hypothetical protein